MAFVVGTDTYISVADANTYVHEHFTSADATAVAWGKLLVADREVLLRRAAAVIDRQPLVGVKADSSQAMEFPRAIQSAVPWGGIFPSTPSGRWSADWVIQASAPVEVQQAQVEIALALMGGASNRVRLQQEGVRSFSLGDLSETYDGSGRAPSARLLSTEARELLSPYLIGAAVIL